MKTTKRRTAVIAFTMLAAALVMASTAQAAPCAGRGPGGGGSTTPLSEGEKAALSAAINEEYLAFNTYTAVIRHLGSILPFSNIANSEQNHYSVVGNLAA